jgi:ketosteroid isomerase-like protein
MSIIDAVNRWYAAWNAHDTAAIADAMSPHGTYLDPVLGSPIDRATTAEHAVANLFTMFPDAHFEVLTVGAMSEISAAAQWRMTGTSTSKGRPVASNGAEFFTYDPLSDRLSAVVGYFDVLTVREQLRAGVEH